jgi:hypothetical protein
MEPVFTVYDEAATNHSSSAVLALFHRMPP